MVVPKLIHPIPPAITSPELSPERHVEDTWMQVTSRGVCTLTKESGLSAVMLVIFVVIMWATDHFSLFCFIGFE